MREKALLFTSSCLPQAVEAFEIMLLAILSTALKCEWGLSSYQEAALTSVG